MIQLDPLFSICHSILQIMRQTWKGQVILIEMRRYPLIVEVGVEYRMILSLCGAFLQELTLSSSSLCRHLYGMKNADRERKLYRNSLLNFGELVAIVSVVSLHPTPLFSPLSSFIPGVNCDFQVCRMFNPQRDMQVPMLLMICALNVKEEC